MEASLPISPECITPCLQLPVAQKRLANFEDFPRMARLSGVQGLIPELLLAGSIPSRNLNLSLITLLRYSKRTAGGLNVCPLNSKKLVALRLLPIGIAYTPSSLNSTGIEVIENDIESVKMNGSSVKHVVSGDDAIKGDEFLISSGMGSTVIASMFGLKLPLAPGWGHSITYDDVKERPHMPVEFSEDGVYAIPMGNSLKATSFFEFRGQSFKPPAERFEYLKKVMIDKFKFLDGIEPASKSSGMRPCTPDSLAILGRSSKFANLFLSFEGLQQSCMYNINIHTVFLNKFIQKFELITHDFLQVFKAFRWWCE